MIISRTPFRISFFGGGTDYPKWYRQHGGSVLGCTINKYCYLTVRELPPFFEHKHRIVYSKVENVKTIAEIEHPAVRAVLSEFAVTTGLEIHHDGDLPARSGLGSSSSFTVGLLHALNALRGQIASKATLAHEAIRIEQDVIQENVGSQDQIWAAYGGLNRIDFHTDGAFDVQPLVIPSERRRALQDHLFLVFTGFSRYASEIAAAKIANLDQRTNHLKAMQAMVDQAASILASPTTPIDEFGALLHESWKLKRGLSNSVSNSSIDEIYEAGRSAGALGGKLLGAGGGGFMLFFVRPHDRARLKAKLGLLIDVAFEFESSGSKIVIYEPDGLATR